MGVVENYLKQFGFTAPPGSAVPESDWLLSGRFTEINGKVQPVLTARAGEIERWRLIHGGVRDTINLTIVKAAAPSPAAPAAGAMQAFAALRSATTPDALASALRSLNPQQIRQFV